MKWSDKDIMNFLDLYENEPILWNASLANHKNRNEVYEAWKRVETNMGGKFSIDDLKRKKESLMATFRSCQKKVKQSLKSGAGSDEIYKPQWFAYSKMANFLRKKHLPRDEINSEGISTPEQSNQDDEAIIITPKQENTLWISDAPFVSPSGSSPQLKSPLLKKRKATDDQEMQDKMNNADSILQATAHIPKEKKNVCTIYGELVAAKLELMDERTREICMHQINNVLFEMRMNTPIYSSSSSTSSSYNTLIPE